MANMFVNTEGIIDFAGKIKTYNSSVGDCVAKISESVSSLDASWDGVVSQNAMEEFHRIKSVFGEKRKTDIDELVTFLEKTVSPGFSTTENENKNLAERFK